MRPSGYFFNNRHAERQLFLARAAIAVIGTLILAGVLVAQMIHLQVTQHDHYSVRSKDNRIRVLPLPPTRGLITDREGRALAENLPTYRLELIPEQVTDLEETLQAIKALVPLSELEEKRFDRAWKRRRGNFNPVPLKFRLDQQQLARLAVNQHRLTGVSVSAHLTRHYPYGASTAHIVGYVGRIDQRNLESVDPSNYAGTTHFGKTGIESTYEDQLHGWVGEQRVETNAAGRQLRVVESTLPIPGEDIKLSIDIELQRYAEQQLGDKAGSVVALDPRNGEVLAFVSLPAYDANLFVNGISVADYKRLNTDKKRPLFNRSLKGQYPPGSTIKQLVGLAGLEHGLISRNHSLSCSGYYLLPNSEHRYRDWKRTGHGRTDLDKALVQSCDVYFYDLARNLGIDRMHNYLSKFGLGQRTGIDLLGERSGLLPSRSWKKERKNEIWYPGETLITGIGQGFMLTTPLQLAHSTAILANGGSGYKPQVTLGKNAEPITAVKIPKRHLRDVERSLHRVTNSRLGTARSLSENHHFHIAGKTGTAQVYALSQNDEDEDAEVREDIPEHLRDHALFVGYAPIKDPKIALAVIVEHGGSGGAVAAPIAGRIMQWWLDNGSPSPASKTPSP
jgi:penicillin-binding protein 2